MPEHYCDNYKFVGMQLKLSIKWKCLCSASPHVELNHRKEQGVELNSVNRVLHGSKEPPAKVCLLCLVVDSSLAHFRFLHENELTSCQFCVGPRKYVLGVMKLSGSLADVTAAPPNLFPPFR